MPSRIGSAFKPQSAGNSFKPFKTSDVKMFENGLNELNGLNT
jgi:hypothetical protein